MIVTAPLTLAAVVVTYNRRDQIVTTVARLLSELCDHVIVVDNGSTDGTREWLETQNDPRLRILLSKENLGGAGGFEWGMRTAVEQYDPDWIVVMDDDGRPEPGALEVFRQQELDGWAGLAAAVYYPDGRICDMNRPTVNPFWHIDTFFRALFRIGQRDAFHLVPEDYAAATPKAIDITSFVGFFISREGIKKAGYPDPALFVYGDDGLYTIGLRQAGGRIAFMPEIRFEHDCSTFIGGNSKTFQPIWKVYYYHRNLLLLYRAAAGWMFWPVLLLILPKWLLKGRHQGANSSLYFSFLYQAVKDGIGKKVLLRRDLPPLKRK